MPRAHWRRRRTTDSPRPAGAGNGQAGCGGAVARPAGALAGQSRSSRRHGRRPAPPRCSCRRRLAAARGGRGPAQPGCVYDAPCGLHATSFPAAPVSPARAAARPPPTTAPAVSIPLLPGERTRRPADQVRARHGLHPRQPAAGHDRDLPRRHRRRPRWPRSPARLRHLRRPRRRPGPQVRRGQPVRRADGLAGRHELVRRRRTGRRLRRGSSARRPTARADRPPARSWRACAAIRLARFNVSPKDGRFFCGVPTTMAAAVLALTVLHRPRPAAGRCDGGRGRAARLAMVSSFPYAKLAKVLRPAAVAAGPAGGRRLLNPPPHLRRSWSLAYLSAARCSGCAPHRQPHDEARPSPEASRLAAARATDSFVAARRPNVLISGSVSASGR